MDQNPKRHSGALAHGGRRHRRRGRLRLRNGSGGRGHSPAGPRKRRQRAIEAAGGLGSAAACLGFVLAWVFMFPGVPQASDSVWVWCGGSLCRAFVLVCVCVKLDCSTLVVMVAPAARRLVAKSSEDRGITRAAAW